MRTPRSIEQVIADTLVRLNSPREDAPSFVRMTKIMICANVQARKGENQKLVLMIKANPCQRICKARCQEILAYIDVRLIIVRLSVGYNKGATASKNNDADNMTQDIPVVLVEPNCTKQTGDRHQDSKGDGTKTHDSCIHHTPQRLGRIKKHCRTGCKVTRGANVGVKQRCEGYQAGNEIRKRGFEDSFLRRCQLELPDIVPYSAE